jgi:hypothetical protein
MWPAHTKNPHSQARGHRLIRAPSRGFVHWRFSDAYPGVACSDAKSAPVRLRAGIDGIREERASRAAVVLIRPEFLSRVIEKHWDADSKKVESIQQFLVRDSIIEAVTVNLVREVANESPSGRLYAERADANSSPTI